MGRISIENLVDKLNDLENKEIELYLKGLIETRFKIKFNNVLKTEDYIDIVTESNEENIKLNLHQIMKIDRISEEEFLVEFDGAQIVNIFVKN